MTASAPGPGLACGQEQTDDCRDPRPAGLSLVFADLAPGLLILIRVIDGVEAEGLAFAGSSFWPVRTAPTRRMSCHSQTEPSPRPTWQRV
jgi:hypothetical protein